MRASFAMKLHLLFRTIYLFLIAQITGIFLAEQLTVYTNPLVFALGPYITPADLLIFFVLSTIAILLVQSIRHAHWFLRACFFFAALAGVLMVFAAVFPVEIALPVAIIFVLSLALIPQVWVHDLVIIVASAGIGGVLGLQLSWSVWMIALLILSLYDLIAVYVTKHMMDVAHRMLKANAIFALIVPEDHRSYRADLSEVRPGAGFLILGGGDVIMPMIFAVSMLLIRPEAVPWVVTGATLGLIANHMILVKTRRPLPALPMITIGCLIGFVIGTIPHV